jgi:tetratricopeptide (TPR) repeat protein
MKRRSLRTAPFHAVNLVFAMLTIRDKTVFERVWHARPLRFAYGVLPGAAFLLLTLCGGGVQAQETTPDSSQAQTQAAIAAKEAAAKEAVAKAAAANSALNDIRGTLAHGDYPGAESALRDFLKQTPDSADAHFLLGFTLLHEQKPTESLAEYTLGAKFRDPSPNELMGVASDYILLKDDADAEHWFAVAAKRAPQNPLIWYMLGRTQYNENHGTDAERSFLTCLKLDPHHLRAEYNLGLVYELLQRPDAAIAAYHTAIGWEEASSSDKDMQPYLNLGILLRKQGKAADALPFLIKGTAGAPRNPLAHQELGLAYEQLDRNDEALGELKAAVSLAPKVESLHFFLGRLYRKTGDQDAAAREFADAARLAGTKTDASVPNPDIRQ